MIHKDKFNVHGTTAGRLHASKYPSNQVIQGIYGFNKYQLGDKMRNSMHIPDEYLPALSKYRMEHMAGHIFQCCNVDGRVRSDAMSDWCAVIYHNCTPYAAKKAKEVRLSFRVAQEEFNLEPIVLVEIVDAGTGE